MAITLRLVKGDTLTFEEMDGNFTDLSSSISESFRRTEDIKKFFLEDPSTMESLISSSVFRVDVGKAQITGSLTLVLSGSNSKFSIVTGSQEKVSYDGSDFLVKANTEVQGTLTVRDPGDTDAVVMSVGGTEVFTIANGTAGTFLSAEDNGNVTLAQSLIVSGVLQLNSQNPAPTPVDGGIIFSGSNFFLGM